MSNYLEKFIERAKQIHGDSYDYGEFVYLSNRDKGNIRCKVHGIFLKSPEKHIHRKQGCPACSNRKKAILKSDTTETFIAKAMQRYGDAHDYTDVIYIDSKTSVNLRCTICGTFFSRNPAHYLSGHGCKECGQQERKISNIERWGVDHHTKTAEYREKVKQTSLERFGVEHASQTQEFKDRAVQTSLNRYGVKYASQMPEFQENVRQTYIEKHGVEHHNQRHLSHASLQALESRDSIVELLLHQSVEEAAKSLGVSYSTLERHCHEHGIELSQSSYEDALVYFLREHEVKVERNNRRFIAPWDMDILLHDHKIGIEIGSNSLHSEKGLLGRGITDPKRYHLTKLERMNKLGYQLITIFEDEWLHHRDIVESRLLHILRKGEKGKGARHLSIMPIEPSLAKTFLDTHHIQGNGPYGFARYGAFDGVTLVAVMTFSRPRLALGRRSGDAPYELLRFATNGKAFAGVASRLFSAFINEYHPDQVISYADRRWSAGNLYRQLNFDFVKESQPSYWYIGKKKTREHRFHYRKSEVKHLVENGDEKTEFQIMRELNKDWIWDCGTYSFLWNAV